jgi:hypothetical protein
MKSRARWFGILRLFVIAVGILVFGLVAAVCIQQRILRWRAEQLLADIRQIQMGKSTWADAQRLMNRWGAWGMWDGSCSSESCKYQIALQDISRAGGLYFWTGTRNLTRSERREYKDWQLRMYSILGGRATQVYASIGAKNGFIWTKSDTVSTTRNISASDFLIGDAEGTTRFVPNIEWELLGSHPEYSIRAAGPCTGCQDGACTICEMIETRFTPFADSGVVDNLSDFNLSCITKWLRCSEPREIMPKAWKMYRQDDSVRRGESVDWPRCRIPIEVAARDYRFALLTQVEDVKAVPEPDGFIRYEARLNPLEDLKGNAMHGQNGLASYLRRVRLGWSDTVLPGGIAASTVKAGDRMMLLFGELPARDIIGIGETACSHVPDTEQNRKAVQRGIDRHRLADVP